MAPSPEAESFYSRGLQLKQSGDSDGALTEFRRAVLSDPNYFEALLEIGKICKLKSLTDPVILRLGFDSFRKAARLNLNHQEAHDGYIMLAQKVNLLDDLLREYDTWSKTYPDNDLLKRCHKNIVTISMAMMPDKVNVSTGGTGRYKKLVIFLLLGFLIVGIGLVFMISKAKLATRSKPMAPPSQVPSSQAAS